MALYKIADLYPNYKQDIFGGEDIKGYSVYAGLTDEKIGTVHDALLDEGGRFRYLVIDTGFWILGKKVLLPVGRCQVNYQKECVYAIGIVDKEQAERLPEYDDDMAIDYDYEENLRSAYRQSNTPSNTTGYTASNYRYDDEPDLYATNEENHQKLKLYEERLVANKQREKTGEVKVTKRVETETASATVPVEKEKIVIEYTPATGATAVAGNADFREAEVARMDVHEETADINKKTFARGEVTVRKEVEQDTVTAKETLRREEVEVDRQGNPDVQQSGRM
ncbi:MAG TPA: DUF2382 domain-containing protein [Oscillatoriales cyanobacterium M59_W2019_021]|nr:DUF2382 domain-containing protein [Oscillatoriales cyanobacterium M4454_W2019_049]HIK53523.1 DUF2382 domain-containing protein [Oscillatoriales cyanobacterium M59_W2019_021]